MRIASKSAIPPPRRRAGTSIPGARTSSAAAAPAFAAGELARWKARSSRRTSGHFTHAAAGFAARPIGIQCRASPLGSKTMFRALSRARFAQIVLLAAGLLAVSGSFGLHPEPEALGRSASRPATVGVLSIGSGDGRAARLLPLPRAQIAFASPALRGRAPARRSAVHATPVAAPCSSREGSKAIPAKAALLLSWAEGPGASAAEAPTLAGVAGRRRHGDPGNLSRYAWEFSPWRRGRPADRRRRRLRSRPRRRRPSPRLRLRSRLRRPLPRRAEGLRRLPTTSTRRSPSSGTSSRSRGTTRWTTSPLSS